MEKWLWLQCVLGFGSDSVRKIFNEYESAEQVYNDYISGKFPYEKLLKKSEIARLKKTELIRFSEVIKRCEECKIKIIPITSKDYPEKLRYIADPPVVLFAKGSIDNLNSLCAITVVGPRKPTDYGTKAAFSLARRLAAAGCLIVSGGAVGIDGMSHIGALSIGKPTLAVLGCGIEVNYPVKNKELRGRISEKGMLISEYPPDFPGSKATYPQRNRILSAISEATVVIEAGEKSGSLITAGYAAEQGKDVFCVPGSPTDKAYAGSNKLLRDGASPLLSSADILERYYSDYATTIDLKAAKAVTCGTKDFNEALNIKPSANNKKSKTAECFDRLSTEASAIITSNLPEAFTADDAAAVTNGDIFSALIELEIEGLIEQLPGGRYKRIQF